MEFPVQIKNLIEAYELLPGIGKKTAERLAFYTLSEMSDEDVLKLSSAIKDVKEGLSRCPKCHGLSTGSDLCLICNDEKRDHSLVMVVESIKDVFIMERMQDYNGVYHVLDGAINFAAGVGVEDLNIESLIERCKSGEVKEVILATNATTEGETTARYIKVMLEDLDVLVTRIAHGLPFGGDISYADEMTLLKAIEGRRNY